MFKLKKKKSNNPKYYTLCNLRDENWSRQDDDGIACCSVFFLLGFLIFLVVLMSEYIQNKKLVIK